MTLMTRLTICNRKNKQTNDKTNKTNDKAASKRPRMTLEWSNPQPMSVGSDKLSSEKGFFDNLLSAYK